jgi:hypothetical protein
VFATNRLVMNPNIHNVGNYRLSITLTDNNLLPRSTTYNIQILVLPVDGNTLGGNGNNGGHNNNNTIPTVEHKQVSAKISYISD